VADHRLDHDWAQSIAAAVDTLVSDEIGEQRAIFFFLSAADVE